MLKALLKKQFLELNTFYFQNRKTGKRRSTGGIIGFVLLYFMLFVGLGFAFYFVSSMFASALLPMGLSWLYFAFMGLVAVLLGVFGSVFNTYTGLYQAKDNELLLSMPIPPSKILLVRMVGVYATGILYESIVFIPVLIAYFIHGTPSALSVVFSILMLFLLGFFILTLTCILGWVVALISSRLKHKSFITVLISIAFFAVYYYFCFNYYTAIQNILANIQTISVSIHDKAFPLYAFGCAAAGELGYMLLVSLFFLAAAAITYLVLSRSFLKLATRSVSPKKAVYQEKAVKAVSVDSALLRKEWKRYTSSATYMLNTSLATLFMPVIAVAAIIFRAKVLDTIQLIGFPKDLIAPLLAAGILMIACMNDISAPSVSLEGKHLWVLQTLPVDSRRVLKAKLRLHWLLTFPPVLFMTAALCFVVQLDLLTAALLLVFSVLVVLFGSLGGLALNLKFPNLTWTNETAPVKQSLPVTVCLFGGWILGGLVGVVGYFATGVLTGWQYLTIVILVLAVLTALLRWWVYGRGTRIFERL